MVFTPSINQNVFEFKVAGSKKTWKLPLRQYLPMAIVERLETNGMRIAKHKDALEEMHRRSLDGEEVEDLPEGFDPQLIVELQEAQRDLFDKYCPGLYDVANRQEINGVMAEWGRVSNIELGESSALSRS
ncbi:hypothetical protein [Glutamicibacter arilaitensis]|uniref:Uncharacterized protein n=1 Tax=Glutamicibacter arilaitensis TaxID=256701 RepID=A0A2N7S652_9MICC|nr:hypothetical protein [Glutamicibacter arilaitensis]PMQ21618.1 hypothetical protein CIK84_08840 [Glutamicibacter arilaitensis]